MINCGQACPYNTLTGCKVKEYGGICPLSNMASTPKPMTNADRIRAMSDEELADWLARTQIDNIAEALAVASIQYDPEDGLKDEVAKDCMEWLKQPAEVDNAENH